MPHVLDCGARAELADQRKSVEEGRSPRCGACGGLLKAAVVSFGQQMPEAELEAAFAGNAVLRPVSGPGNIAGCASGGPVAVKCCSLPRRAGDSQWSRNAARFAGLLLSFERRWRKLFQVLAKNLIKNCKWSVVSSTISLLAISRNVILLLGIGREVSRNFPSA